MRKVAEIVRASDQAVLPAHAPSARAEIAMSSLRTFLASVLAAIIVIELSLRLAASALYERAGDAYSIFLATERLLLRSRDVSPDVVFGGDSLTRENVAPYPLAAALGLQRKAVLNLATSAGRPSDMRQFYQDYRADLGRSRLLIYGVDAVQFNAASDSSVDNRFKARSTLPDRLTFPLTDKVPDLALGYLWRVWDLRPELHEQTMAALARRKTEDPPKLDLDDLGRIESKTPDRDPSTDASYAAEHLKEHTLWEFELGALRDLVGMAREDGVRLVVVEWPLRTTYTRAVERQYAAQDRAWKDAVRSIAGEAAFVEAGSPSRWGLTDSDFYDYGHLSERGARRFTTALARWTGRLLSDPRKRN
jgi:hypothetical protein